MRKSNQASQNDCEMELEFSPLRIRIVEAEELTTPTDGSKRKRSALVQHFQNLADQIDEDIQRILNL